jgi:hypothetical protein
VTLHATSAGDPEGHGGLDPVEDKPLAFQLLESLDRAIRTASSAMTAELTEGRQALALALASMGELGIGPGEPGRPPHVDAPAGVCCRVSALVARVGGG